MTAITPLGQKVVRCYSPPFSLCISLSIAKNRLFLLSKEGVATGPPIFGILKKATKLKFEILFRIFFFTRRAQRFHMKQVLCRSHKFRKCRIHFFRSK